MSVPEPATPDDAALWLHQLYGTAEGGWLSLFSVDHATGDRHVDWTPAETPGDILAAVERRNRTGCVWLGCAIRRDRIGGGRRGEGKDCTHLPGLWLDIDVAGPAHADNDALAQTYDDAHALIRRFPLPPTVVVDSGHGLQPWWLFDELLTIDDHTETILAAWQATWSRLGVEAGAMPDDVSDIARVMRVPGTVNRKTEPVPVTIVSADWSRRYGVDDLDQHLDEPPPPRKAERVPYIGPRRPGDEFKMRHTCGDVLARAGFTLARGRPERNGDEHWIHPWGATSDNSVTVFADDGHATIWSPNVVARWPSAELRRPYDAFGLYVHAEHSGDFSAARAALTDLGYGAGVQRDDRADLDAMLAPPATANEHTDGHTAEPDGLTDGTDWLPRPLGAALADDYEPERPTVLHVAGGSPLFYAERINSIFGESGVGKSWLAIAAIAEAIRSGGLVALIDYEDTLHGAVGRLRMLGLSPAQIEGGLHYIAPETPWGVAAHERFVQLAAERRIDLVIIDSVGEAMAAASVKGNDDDDVARWFVRFPKALTRLGMTVVTIDHVPKATDRPSGYAIGSQRKRAAVTGSAFEVTAVKVPSRTKNGLLKLVTAKDRHGTHAQRSTAAMVSLDHDGDALRIELKAPEDATGDDGRFRPTGYMEKVSRFLDGEPGASKAAIEGGVEGKATFIRDALQALIDEGYVRQAKGARGALEHYSERPYSELHELTTPPRPTSSHLVPAGRDEVDNPPRPSSHPLKGDEDEDEVKGRPPEQSPRPDFWDEDNIFAIAPEEA